MKRFITFALLFVFVGFPGCNKEDSSSPVPPSPAEFTVDKFPHTVGWQFKYARGNTIEDTVLVRIVSDTTLNGGEYALLWEFSYPGLQDTILVSFKDDTVVFALNRVPTKFIFPLEVGNQWTGLPNDSTTVEAMEPLTVGDYQFPESYVVHHFWFGPNDYEDTYYWLVPEVGIAKIDKRVYPVVHEIWELMDFALPESR